MKITIYILFGLIFLAFTGCKSERINESSLDYSKQNLKIFLSDPVTSLDPLEIIFISDWKVASNIYEGLFTFDNNEKIIPKLVESYTVSENKLFYRFTLKNNIYFHDNPAFKLGKGKRLSTYDVKYTFERLANKENNFSNWQIIENSIEGINKFYNGESNNIKGIKIIDSTNFSIELTQPFGALLKFLASPNCYIVPKEAIDYYENEFRSKPVGSGPFRLSENNKYEKIILVRNENYYEKDSTGKYLPYLNSVEYNTIMESETRFGQLIKNTFNIISVNENEFNNYYSDKIISDTYNYVKIDKGVSFRFWSFYFTEIDYTQERKNLRKSIASAINRKSIYKDDTSVSLSQSLIPRHFLKDEDIKWYTYNENINYDNSNYISDTLIIFTNIKSNDLIEVENSLKKINLPFKTASQPTQYYQNIKIVKPYLFRVSMLPAFPDPLEYYSLFYSKSSSEINLGRFSNKEYDKIFEHLISESDSDKLKEYYVKLEKILKDEVAAIYLTHEGPKFYIYSNNIRNLEFNYMIPNYTKLYFE